MNTLTSDGLATPKELNTYITSLEDTKLINKHEASDLRKVFGKELAKKDMSSESWSLFGRPQGISETRLEHDTLGSRSIDHQIYSGLSGHDKITRNKLADAIRSTLKAVAQGGQGTQYGLVTKREVDATIAYTETMPGYTARDRNAIKNILYRALGEKPKSTPTLHPLSTGQVIHKKTADVEVTPPPVDEIEKTSLTDVKPKPPVMHTPPFIQGTFVAGAAVAPAWKERHGEAKDVSVQESESEGTSDTEADTETSSNVEDSTSDETQGASTIDETIAEEQVPATKGTPSRPIQPLSSRASIKARLEKRRAERAVFTQHEQTSTKFSHASHVSSTEAHASSRQTPGDSSDDRFARRKAQRKALNAAPESNEHTEESKPTRMSFALNSFTAHTPNTNTNDQIPHENIPTTSEKPTSTQEGGNISPRKDVEAVMSAEHASIQADTTQSLHKPAMKFHLPHILTQDTESALHTSADEEQDPEASTNPTVEFTTNLGAIAIELFITDMPNTAGHILALAKHGAYTGVKFHRVVADYVIQAGEGVGSADSSAIPKDEPKEPHSNMRGAVSLVSADKNVGGGIFSINVVNNVILDGRYPVFGRVIAGLDVVDAIAKVPVDNNEVPKNPIVIESVTVS